MEPEGSLPHSQVPATCSYPDAPCRGDRELLITVYLFIRAIKCTTKHGVPFIFNTNGTADYIFLHSNLY